jgi:hypothetical protein
MTQNSEMSGAKAKPCSSFLISSIIDEGNGKISETEKVQPEIEVKV